MSSHALLAGVVVAEALAVVALLVSLVVASAVLARRQLADRRMLAWLGSVGISTNLDPGGDGNLGELLAQLRALPRRRRASALLRVLEPLSGDAAVQLAALARPAGVERIALAWCGSTRWHRRLRGVRVLVAIGAGEDMASRMLADPSPVVRAEATGLAAAFPSPERIATLLAMLANDQARCRFGAKDALLRAGSPATGALAGHLAGGEQITADALEVAAGIATPDLVPSALAHSADLDPEHRLWAARLLGASGAPEARERLRELLLSDPSAAVRSAAARGLAMLGDPGDASRLAGALTDPAWDVRRTSAVGLRQFGPAGRLYLRRALKSADRFAADIARQVLDEADGSEAAS